MTGLLIVYVCYIYLDQLYQSALIINPRTLQTQDQALHLKKRIQGISKELGLSDFSLANRSDIELKRLSQLKGKIVDRATIYLKVTQDHEEKLTKKEYEGALSQVSRSKFPQRTQFVRIHLNLLYKGQRTFVLAGEERVDYSPANMRPSSIQIQYRQDYHPLASDAKQIWASVPEFDTHQLTIGSRSYGPSAFSNDTNMDIMDDSNETNISYHVDWQQPDIFRDIVGLDFIHVTEFEVPKNASRVDVYVQQDQPHVSEQLTYELKSQSFAP